MRSKVVMACAIIWLSTIELSAQNKDKRYHNFGTERSWKSQVYAGLLAAFSNVEGVLAVDFGATGGILYKKKLIAGLYGQKMVTSHIRTNLSISDYPAGTEGEIEMIHVGGIAGYIFKPEAVMHWGVSGSAGVGKLELLVRDPLTNETGKTYSDRIYIVVPRIFAEVNMTQWFKINITCGYRFPGKVNSYYTNQSGEEVPVFNNSDYTKPEFSVSLLFGTYGFRTATFF